jgi:hypothetical protein
MNDLPPPDIDSLQRSAGVVGDERWNLDLLKIVFELLVTKSCMGAPAVPIQPVPVNGIWGIEKEEGEPT